MMSLKILSFWLTVGCLSLFRGDVSRHHVFGTANLIHNVNTLIGTSYFEDQFDVHDYGNTAPFAGPPHAHTPWTAQTRDSEDKCQSPYYYFDSFWHGMRRSHWISGSCTIDYGSATVIPSITPNLNDALTFHAMNHSAETSTPSYYGIDLKESSLRVEASSDMRSGIMIVTPIDMKEKYFYLIFKASDTMYNESSINILRPHGEGENDIESEQSESDFSYSNLNVDSLTISSPVHRWYQSKGKNAEFSGHHHFKTSRPAFEFGIIEGYANIKKNQFSGISDKSGTVAAYFKFETVLGEVRVATGTSFISVQKAMMNMHLELQYSKSYSGISSSSADPRSTDMLKKSENIDVELVPDQNEKSSFEQIYNDRLFDMNRLVTKNNLIWEEKLSAIDVTPHTDDPDEILYVDNDPNRNNGQKLNESNSKNQLITFYSALWHAQLLPRIISDFDGEYLTFGDNERKIEKTSPKSNFYNYFDDFSMWDIFRAQLPLFSLIYTENIPDMVTSLLKKAEHGNWLPIFPAWNSYTDEMIGDHCAVFIADVFQKGIISSSTHKYTRTSDVSTSANKKISNNKSENPDSQPSLLSVAYRYLIKNALIHPSEIEYKKGKGRRALRSYEQYGFIPLEDEILDSAHIKQQVSRTLEYSYDDYVVSQLALLYYNEIVNKAKNIIENDIEKVMKLETILLNVLPVVNILSERSQNYRWVIDGNTSHIWYEKNKNGPHTNLLWTETLDSINSSENNFASENDNNVVSMAVTNDGSFIEKSKIINNAIKTDKVEVTETTEITKITDKAEKVETVENVEKVEKVEGSVGFIRGRYSNLTWTETLDTFNPATHYTWLTETDVWQYTFSVLHDIIGLIQIYNGPENFVKKLDEFFDYSWYNHGNEPDHHVLYLYSYVKGYQYKIQERLSSIISTQYGPLERSMSGNDDAGQMSAWLILSSIGFYQVCPGCGGRNEYVLGVPLFSKIVIKLPSNNHNNDSIKSQQQEVQQQQQQTEQDQDKNDNNEPKKLIIEAIRTNNKSTDKYIQEVTWNGCTYDCAFFPHIMLAGGGHLIVTLGPVPNKSWGGDGRECMIQYHYPGDEVEVVEGYIDKKIRTC